MGIEGSWVVESLAVGGELQPPIDGSTLTLEMAEGRAFGSSGVNRFTGALDGAGGFGTMASTRMAGPHELMAQEQIFLDHLGSTETIEITDEGISLVGDGLVLVTLVPACSGPGSESSRSAS